MNFCILTQITPVDNIYVVIGNYLTRANKQNIATYPDYWRLLGNVLPLVDPGVDKPNQYTICVGNSIQGCYRDDS